MDLPKCKICGERHRLGPCPPTSSDGGEVTEPNALGRELRSRDDEVRSSCPTSIAPREIDAECPGGSSALLKHPIGEKPMPSGAKFDRVAYQREYMRKRRAHRNING